MINYNDFVILLKEGLIKTHSILNNKTYLEHQIRFLGFDAYINIDNKYTYEFEILNPSWFNTTNTCELFFNFNSNFGYYPNNYTLYRDDKKRTIKFKNKLNSKYEELDLEDFINNLKNVDKVVINFEAKFSTGLYKNDVDIPDVIYHLSPIKYRHKILENGLEPKSNNRKNYHKDRIYFFKNLDDYKKLLLSLKSVDRYNLIEEYDIIYDLYEIKLDKNNIILHIDPYFNDGYYTYDNIHPKSVELIKKDL